jgi:hypothetical protein
MRYKERVHRSALAVAIVLALGHAAAAEPYRPALETLGRAYAADVGQTLREVRADAPVPVTAANQGALAARAEQALAVGNRTPQGRFEAVALARAGPLPVTMAGGRTPAAVVRALVVPGNVVVPVSWSFAPEGGEAGEPVRSLMIFAPGGEPLFDTLLSLPIVPGALLATEHF